MSKIISIIGSRETPKDQLAKLTEIAEFFAKKGYILRTGGSWGADQAALDGFLKVPNSKVELYLPWQGFNDHYNKILWSQENWDLAATYHPKWDELKLNNKIFHARNIGIILGLDNRSPSNLTVCWTPEGKEVGGSATGIKCSVDNKIPVFNLGLKTGLTKLRKYCKKLP
jgi:hypothetical protein